MTSKEAQDQFRVVVQALEQSSEHTPWQDIPEHTVGNTVMPKVTLAYENGRITGNGEVLLIWLPLERMWQIDSKIDWRIHRDVPLDVLCAETPERAYYVAHIIMGMVDEIRARGL